MKGNLSRLALAALLASGTAAVLSMHAFAQQGYGVQGIDDAAVQQILVIASMKQGFTEAQQKIDSNLVFAAKIAGGDPAAATVADIAGDRSATPDTTVEVDIYGNVTDSLLEALAAANGVLADQSQEWGMIRASLPLGAIETVAAHPDVRSIQSAAEAVTNAGALTSQGYVAHTANQAVNDGVRGDGVTVGVLSDSALPARIAALIASGDLPASVQVLPGQQGPSTGTDEGAAMMEIVHDIAPGANLIYATAFTSVASFANNILALHAAGASVIVDDVSYFNEGAFQDGPIARAVIK
jgi:hypothetical protein